MQRSRFSRIAAVAATIACAALTPAALSAEEFVGYIDNVYNAEDLVLIPGTDWVVASSLKAPEKVKPAYLYLINAKTHAVEIVDAKISPSSTAGDPSCKPIDLKSIGFSGMGTRDGTNGKHQLLAVGRSERFSIEFFDIDASGEKPVLTWAGCVVMPDKAVPNHVVATANGGMAVTVPSETTNKNLIEQLEKKENTGYLLTWTREAGFTRVAGGESGFTNGLEVDADGTHYFVSDWGGEKLLRVPASAGTEKPVSVDLGMRPDNMNWTRAGTLYVAGHMQSPTKALGCVATKVDVCPVPFKILEVDPKTMSVLRVVVDGTSMENFAAATGALEVGDEIWSGSFRNTKIARYKSK